MTEATRPRILVVDDEEAILETMTFTFQDDYEVHTASDPRVALGILDERSPFAVVLTDQRMPTMDGVEFLAEVWKRHPATIRIILTGFSDMQAMIQAINDGHVYAYITKPWEPEHLKQVMKQAIDHYELAAENEQLLERLRRANVFLEAVMDQLDTGALAVDASGVVQAVNRPVREYLALEGDLRGKPLQDVLAANCLEEVGGTAYRLAGGEPVAYADCEVHSGRQTHRLRMSGRELKDESGQAFGRVILFREISHEPLRRRFDDLVKEIMQTEGALREVLERARGQLGDLAAEVKSSRIDSAGMSELGEQVLRTGTAVENWLDVDDAMAQEEFPDAQLLQDRMRIAAGRWPLSGEVPERVRELAHRVEEYYESGENSKRRVL